MSKEKVYIGKDPNYRYLKCRVISREGNSVKVEFSNEILGKVIGIVKTTELI